MFSERCPASGRVVGYTEYLTAKTYLESPEESCCGSQRAETEVSKLRGEICDLVLSVETVEDVACAVDEALASEAYERCMQLAREAAMLNRAAVHHRLGPSTEILQLREELFGPEVAATLLEADITWLNLVGRTVACSQSSYKTFDRNTFLNDTQCPAAIRRSVLAMWHSTVALLAVQVLVERAESHQYVGELSNIALRGAKAGIDMFDDGFLERAKRSHEARESSIRKAFARAAEGDGYLELNGTID